MEHPSSYNLWHLGTIGFGYVDWRGGFYPPHVKTSGYLAHYSRIFNAVEIDSTFHAVPKPDILRRWVETTPADFCFALKMPQQITHQPDINRNALTLDTFLRTARVLGEKLGPILIQLPPSFRADRVDELKGFLNLLPGDLRFAVEVRHPSWFMHKVDETPPLVNLLAENGICLASTDFPGLPSDVWQTTDFLFVRWIGQNGSFSPHTHIQLDRYQELKGWKERLVAHTGSVKAIFGFFNNDYAGFAPGSTVQFRQLLGQQVVLLGTPIQARLF